MFLNQIKARKPLKQKPFGDHIKHIKNIKTIKKTNNIKNIEALESQI